MSLVEVMIALALMSLLSIITVTGMIMHGRLAKSNHERQRIAEASRRFVDDIQVRALDATILRVDPGPTGAGTVLTIGAPNPSTPGVIDYRQYAYIDADGTSSTTEDNRIVLRSENKPTSTEGELVLDNCSPAAGAGPVFTMVAGTARPLVNVKLRVGDRTFPASANDDRLTGRGYQSFLIYAFLSSY